MATSPSVESQDLSISSKMPSQSVTSLDATISQDNAEEGIEPGLAHTHLPGAITELRALSGDSVKYGHYTDLKLLFQYAIELNGQGYATYACINPLRPECVTGLNGQPTYGNTARDEHIAELRYLVYDVDPTRKDPEGKPLEVAGANGKKKKLKCAATDTEKQSARAVATRVYDFYVALGVSPVLIDSGNGFYVLVPISLKPEEKYLCAALLSRHAIDFNIAGEAEIDESCSNPSRILRIPGTRNCKGRETPDRPHRICKVLVAGNRDRVLTAADLQQLVPTATPPEPEALGGGDVDLEAQWMECFLEYSQILHGARRSADGGYMWLLEPNLDYCPNSAEHGEPDNATTLAVFVRRDGKRAMRCHHAHCSKIDPATKQYNVKWSDFREAAEARNMEEGRGRFSLDTDCLLPDVGYWSGLHWFAHKADYEAHEAEKKREELEAAAIFARKPPCPPDCLEGDLISDFMHAITDGTGIPPQLYVPR